MLGTHAEDNSLTPLHPPPRLAVPDLPFGLVARPGLRLFNVLNYRRQWRRRVATTVHYDPYFYPLDAVEGWNRLYGPRGFLQFQFAVPFADGKAVMKTVLERTDRAAPCALAVLKTFGDHPAGPLGFPLPGFTLALDFPRTDTIEDAVRAATDDVIAAGGRVYLAKDSVITRDQFDAMYPRLEEFRRLRHEVDPQGRFRSVQSARLGLS
jgi:decaprenylphospho-beta-D-ribofuranose 2-oxidase